jgi:2',3'-cyclic-nucleotide 2'-phosphodiesterase (5'-nucleotidase family)
MSIFLNKVGSASSTTASEIPAFDPASDRLYVVAASKVDIYSVSDKGVLAKVGELTPGFSSAAGTAIAPNSVAIKNGLVAVAYEVRDTAPPNTIQKGRVSFFRAADGFFLNSVEVGFLPDMLTFTPDGTKVLVANEGEPNENYTNDPEGSVSVITITNVNLAGGTIAATVQEAGFTGFNSQSAQLKANGVRLIGPTGTTVAQDVEPEYIAVSPDGLTATVTLQEANAIATLNIATATITGIKPLGLKNHNLTGNGIDASDRDVNGTSGGGGTINIKNVPVFGMYQPDAIASFAANGQTYYITANEGDSRVRPTSGTAIPSNPSTPEGAIYNEEARVGDTAYVLDPIAFPNAADLKKPENLGRLTVSNKTGDIDGDGDFDQIHAFGSRSFTIWDATGNLIYDSGDQLEKLTAQFNPTGFNSDGVPNAGFDTRSDNKGPEPEGVTVGTINGRTYAFIGLERVGDVIVYDITNPVSPTFVQYVNPAEDRGVEGITFVSAADSPTGKPLVITANETSNTVSVFETAAAPVTTGNFTLQVLHGSDFEGGIPAVNDAIGFSAVVNKFKDDARYKTNTLILSSGDNYIPGPFLTASSDRSLDGIGGLPVTPTANNAQPVIGRGDIGILNAIGIQASALGNHEFDLGIRQVRDIIRTGNGNPGTAFPYLSTNLDFSPEIFNATTNPNGNLATTDLAANQNTADASTIKGKIAKSTVINVAGIDGLVGTPDDQRIGIVGATTPTLASISSSGSTIVKPAKPTDYDALAAEIQASVDILKAQGINKIILLSHMQQLNIERDELAKRLKDVDIIIAGGSHTLLSDANDILRTGDSSKGDYPVVKTGADGKPVLVVNTDANYKYVGRLVTEFDNDGVIQVNKLDSAINGAYATDDAGVDRVYGSNVDTRAVANQNVVAIADGIQNVIKTKDSQIVGKANVFLNGSRGDVRTEETNFGNLTADANLALARQVDSTVLISLKNGGGIRDNIGVISAAAGAVNNDDVIKLPTQLNALAPNKKVGDVSRLDIENSLRFNNDLTLITVTAQQLRQVIEHAVAGTAPGATPGQFPQVSGLSFSFDTTKTAIAFNTATGAVTTQGDRVRNLVVLNEDGSPRDIIVKDGVLVGDASRTFRLITLNFLAGTSLPTPTNALGGDSYPFAAFVKENPVLANRVDLRGETVDLNGNGKVDAPVALNAGKFTFAAAGSEQDALAEYLGDKFSTTAYSNPDVSAALDTRIQNLSVRTDTIQQSIIGTPKLVAVGSSGNDDISPVANTSFDGREDIVFTGAGNDIITLTTVSASTIAGNNRVDAGSGNDEIYVNINDRLFGGDGNDEFFAQDSKGGNRMSGGAGNDFFYLGAGDRALGGDGNDQFFVSTGGNNLLSGGAGADIFNIVMAGTIPTGFNTILDFQSGTDTLQLNGLGAAFGIGNLTLSGNNIAIGSSVIATLTGVETSSLTTANFKFA